jgi:3-(3-hydroxy-phenyl)propionate hydroxylase
MERAESGRVTVVGAGPVGLTVAYILAREGIDVQVLEAGTVPSTEWRASTFHPPTLELYDSIGVTDDMLAGGLVARHYQIRDRKAGLVAEFDLDVLRKDTRYPFRLQYEQYKLVQLLRERLDDAPNAVICFEHEFLDVAQDSAGATATVRTPEGVRTITVPYLLGADGATSTVRQRLGLAFDGLTYVDRYLLLSTTFPFERHLSGIRLVNYIADPDEHMMLLRIPDVWRVLFSVRPGEESAALTEPEGERRLQRVVACDEPFPVLQRQLYQIHQRVSSTFRVGRVLLLGDAAHVNSPFGGMGLNSGVHDAFDLGARLARVLDDEATADEELTAYTTGRRRVATNHVRANTHRNTRSLAERDPVARKENQAEMAAIATDPERARAWLLDASMITAVREQRIGVRD